MFMECVRNLLPNEATQQAVWRDAGLCIEITFPLKGVSGPHALHLYVMDEAVTEFVNSSVVDQTLARTLLLQYLNTQFQSFQIPTTPGTSLTEWTVMGVSIKEAEKAR